MGIPEDITEAHAERLNALREVFGPAGDLTALRFTGETVDDANVYESLKTYAADEGVNGWLAKTAKGSDGAHYTRVEIADVDDALAGLVDSDGGLTDWAFGGKVYKVEADKTVRPVSAPFIWEFTTYVDTKGVFP